jgi:WD40 repeat protein
MENLIETSVIRILDKNGNTIGTGFIVQDDLAVTCAHVVEDAGSSAGGEIPIKFFHGNEQQTVTVLQESWSDRNQDDVAFLRLEMLPEDISPVRMGSSHGRIGHHFVALGFPSLNGYQNYWAQGNLSDFVNVIEPRKPLLQLQGDEILKGMSGAPVYDVEANVIVGMISEYINEGYTRIAYATATETLQAYYKQLDISEVCPYKGLFVFQTSDASFFYGRDDFIQKMVDRLKRIPSFLAVLGPSGSGKSSVVQAGLIPALLDGKIPGSEKWEPKIIRPAQMNFNQIQSSGIDQFHEILAEFEENILDLSKEKHLLLVIDQFEEALLEEQRAASIEFLNILNELVDHAQEFSLIIILRDEFYSRLSEYAPNLIAWVERNSINIPAELTLDELTSIIQKPVTANFHFEDGLIERIIDDVLEISRGQGMNTSGGRSAILPLLEFSLAQLWEKSQNGWLTHRAYNEINGITGSLTLWADQAYRELHENHRELARQIFVDLVHFGDEKKGIPDSRQRLRIDQLVTSVDDPVGIQKVIQHFVNKRLMVTSEDPMSKEENVEIIHDALVREWGILHEWIKKDREFSSWRGRFRDDLEKWLGSGQNKSELLTGLSLAEAEDWLKKRSHDLTDQETRFIQGSKRAIRNRQIGIYGIIASIILVGGFIGFEFLSFKNAQRQSQLTFADQLAALSIPYQNDKIDLAYLLSIEAYQTVKSFSENEITVPRNNLLSVLGRSPYMLQILQGHRANVFAVAFNPMNNKFLASADAEGEIYLWQQDTANTEDATTVWENIGQLKSDHGAIWDITFSPDGKTLVAGNEDSTITFWTNITSTQAISQTFDKHTNDVYSVVISPDGKYLATGSRDNTIGIWDFQHRSFIKFISDKAPYRHTSLGVNSLAFSPDSTTLASGGGDGTIFLWNTMNWVNSDDDSDIPITRIVPKNGSIWSLIFSPDGKVLTAGTSYKNILVWDVGQLENSPNEPSMRILTGHQDWVYNLSFSRDGSKLASASRDHSILLWDTSDWRPIVRLFGHGRAVVSVDFNAGGDLLASGGNDGKVILWNIPDFSRHVPEGSNQSITASAVNFAYNSVALAVQDTRENSKALNGANEASVDNELTFLDGSSGSPIGAPVPVSDTITNTVSSMEFSPDGNTLVIGERNTRLYVFKAPNWNQISPPSVHHSMSVDLLAFSSDGRYMASAGCHSPGVIKKNRACLQSEIIIWDTKTWTPIGPPILAHRDEITSLAFSPDDRMLASGSCAGRDSFQYCTQGEISLWDVSSERFLRSTINGPNSDVEALAFSPDGKILVSGGCNQGGNETGCLEGEILLWDVNSMESVGQTMLGHIGAITTLDFSDDGRFLASAGSDATIVIWNMENHQPMGRPFVGHSDKVESIRFDPANQFIDSGSQDGTIRKWPLNTFTNPSDWVKIACQRVGRNFTAVEWNHFFPGRARRKTCNQWP